MSKTREKLFYECRICSHKAEMLSALGISFHRAERIPIGAKLRYNYYRLIDISYVVFSNISFAPLFPAPLFLIDFSVFLRCETTSSFSFPDKASNNPNTTNDPSPVAQET